MRRAKEKVGELFNCHVNKLSQTIVAGHLATGHKVVFKSSSSSSSSMVRMERGSSMGRKETRNMLFVINPYFLDNLLVYANTGLRAKRTDNVIVSY